jgi:hypothetical protein
MPYRTTDSALAGAAGKPTPMASAAAMRRIEFRVRMN